jgi:hypothetical protein
MKIAEDSEDLNDKWKSQVASKDGQINILKEQVEYFQEDQEKQRLKVKSLNE